MFVIPDTYLIIQSSGRAPLVPGLQLSSPSVPQPSKKKKKKTTGPRSNNSHIHKPIPSLRNKTSNIIYIKVKKDPKPPETPKRTVPRGPGHYPSLYTNQSKKIKRNQGFESEDMSIAVAEDDLYYV